MAYLPERAAYHIERDRPRRAERPWLETLKNHMSGVTTDAAMEYWPPVNEEDPPYYNFRMEHILQVERDALRVHAVERGDLDVVLAAVWLHDRFQPQFTGENHAERAEQWAKDYLKFVRFPDSKIRGVCQAIKLHSHSDMDIPESCREARILWDADHLTRLGPADILNYMLCHTSQDFLCGLPSNGRFPTGAITIRDFAPMLIERRPPAYRSDFFYFDESRRMARQRIEATRAFLDCLEAQVAPPRVR